MILLFVVGQYSQVVIAAHSNDDSEQQFNRFIECVLSFDKQSHIKLKRFVFKASKEASVLDSTWNLAAVYTMK